MGAHRRNIRKLCLAGTAMAGALGLMAAPAYAQEQTFELDVPSQRLDTALRAFAQQSRQQLMFAVADTKGFNAPALNGSYTADQAIGALLAGTGLEVHRNASGVFLIASASDPQSGSAAGGGAEVEALIVTAQKREEDIQDVPIAISAFTQEDLERSQIAGGPDLITQVPNMTFTKTNFSSYSIQLRGIGTQAISATTDPAVAVAFNNTPFIRNRFFEQEFYDLQRVEVLRGPQGTLYGRNATAGVVNIISQKPKFNFEAKVSGDISNYSSSRLEGMVNVPLVEDIVALRLAGAWTKRDGYAVNELTGNPIDGRDLWSTRLSLRISPTDRLDANLIWEHFEEEDDRLRSGKQLCKKDVVTDIGGTPINDYFDTRTSDGQANALWAGVQATLSQGCTRNSLYARDSFQRPNGLMLPYYVPLGAIGLPIALSDPYVSVIDSSDPWIISQTNDQIEDLRAIQSIVDPVYTSGSDLGELQISFDLIDGLTIQSETAFATDAVYSRQDFNRFNTARGAWDVADSNSAALIERGILSPEGVFCDPQLGCSDRLVAVDVSTAEASQFSQELRLSSDFDGPFNFSLGGNYLRADSEDKYYVFINSLSLVAAVNAGAVNSTGDGLDYIPNVSDNEPCLNYGYLPGDPNDVYTVTACAYMDPNPIGRVNDHGHNYFLSKNPYKLISYALFGEAYYKATDDLKVTLGLRWTVDKKEAPRIPTWILANQSVGYPVAEVIEQEWREPTGRFTVDWKPDLAFTDETLVYASYAHGYKAGGANPPGFVRVFYADKTVAETSSRASATRPTTFDAEFVDAFEVGSKNTSLDGALTLNLAAFYYDYKDYQISEIVDRSAFNRNFDATVWGAELEADWRPLENLRFGVKGGYEKTRIAEGEQAIDLMDRTAGDPNWMLVRPFPTFASSCILPTRLYVNPDGSVSPVGTVGGGGPSGCELAYSMGLDPVTEAQYVDLTTSPPPAGANLSSLAQHPGYIGWDPATAPNGGEGIMKDLGGSELPNAPNWTATITADYTIPLPNDWLMNLHTDLHWQSESHWRLFQDHEYSELDEYFTMNLAAILTNEERGWNIMAYIKNVTDETAITGAFLNSDDTGLTTNVFLTEPRLYGLRVTKTWEGGPLLGSFGGSREGPRAFTLELGGHLQRHDAPNEAASSLDEVLDERLEVYHQPQASDLDWGDGRDIKLTWRPSGGRWAVSASLRAGETNGHNDVRARWDTDPTCIWKGFLAGNCEAMASDPIFGVTTRLSLPHWSEAVVVDNEQHQVIELNVAIDFDIPVLSRSTLSAGLRHAQIESATNGLFRAVTDWVPAEINPPLVVQNYSSHTRYASALAAEREFEGIGPVVSWEASYPMHAPADWGAVQLDWRVSGGVLFGDQKASVRTMESARDFLIIAAGIGSPIQTSDEIGVPVDSIRSKSISVPTLGAELGLSYEVNGFRVGAGYRWERYFDAIDGGFEEHKSYDRTIDGPYFKLSYGFGG